MIAGVEIENRSCEPDHAPFGGGLLSKSYDSIQCTCVQNFTILALAVPEMSRAQKFIVSHMTPTTPL